MKKINALLNYLQANGFGTKKDFWIKLGYYNSGDGIYMLRKRGYEIETVYEYNGKDRYARYVYKGKKLYNS